MAHSRYVTLDVRQQPVHALVTQESKEKGLSKQFQSLLACALLTVWTGRKPVDPPPIVEMRVDHGADPTE